MFNGKRVVVTGSSGFVGKNLVKELEKGNAKVIKLDIKDGLDISNWENVKLIRDFDLIYHLAAKIYVPDSYEQPYEFYYDNIISTLNMLELCRLNNAKMIFASSYVYGIPEYLPIDEQHPMSGFNPYAQSKIICEKLCEGYNRDFGVPLIIIRPSNTYGRGQNNKFLIPTMIEQSKTGKILLKDSRPRRDYVYIDDLVDAYIKAYLFKESDFEVFNIGYGESHSVKEIVDMIVECCSDEIEVKFSHSDRKIEIMDTVYNINKAKTRLNWLPKTSFLEGIMQILSADPMTQSSL